MKSNTNISDASPSRAHSSRNESTPSHKRLVRAAVFVGLVATSWLAINQRNSDEPQQFEVPKDELEALQNLTDQQILDMGINRYMVFRAGEGENLTEIATRIDEAISTPRSDPSLDVVMDEVREQAIAHDGSAGLDAGERVIVNSPPMGPIQIP